MALLRRVERGQQLRRLQDDGLARLLRKNKEVILVIRVVQVGWVTLEIRYPPGALDEGKRVLEVTNYSSRGLGD